MQYGQYVYDSDDMSGENPESDIPDPEEDDRDLSFGLLGSRGRL